MRFIFLTAPAMRRAKLDRSNFWSQNERAPSKPGNAVRCAWQIAASGVFTVFPEVFEKRPVNPLSRFAYY
jgi:hypothetical protein